METVLVLAMHGAPPRDFPRQELVELMTLHGRLGHGGGPQQAEWARRYAELESKMRGWPRTAENDPFHAASLDLARQLQRATGYDVIVGFNEFCGPSLDEALAQAVGGGAEKVVVVTPMMTRGGEHAEVDIPAAVQHAREKYPRVGFYYAWPFADEAIAKFLAGQLSAFLGES